MFILKKGHQPGVYVPLRALFLVCHVVAISFGPSSQTNASENFFRMSKCLACYHILAYSMTDSFRNFE